jgi:phenolic acid decarboxylase
LKISLHKLLKKIGYLSLTIALEIPWRRTILVTNNFVISFAVYGCVKEMKWAYLDNRSTTTMTEGILPPIPTTEPTRDAVSPGAVLGFVVWGDELK